MSTYGAHASSVNADDAALPVENHDRQGIGTHGSKSRITGRREPDPPMHHFGGQILDPRFVRSCHDGRIHPGAPSSERERYIEGMARPKGGRGRLPIEPIEEGAAAGPRDGACERFAGSRPGSLRHEIEKNLTW